MSEEDGEKQQPDADTLARELLRDYPVEEILARLTKNEAQITMMMNMTEKLQKENMQLKVDRANLDKEKIRLLARISYLNEEFKDNTTLLPPICANPNDALKPAPADSLTERADKLVSDFSDKSFKNRLSVVEASMIDFKEAKASMQVTIKRQAEQKHELIASSLDLRKELLVVRSLNVDLRKEVTAIRKANIDLKEKLNARRKLENSNPPASPENRTPSSSPENRTPPAPPSQKSPLPSTDPPSPSSSLPKSKTCMQCSTLLPRSAFPKKSFKTDTPICTSCRKTSQASALKQHPPAKNLLGNNHNAAGVKRSPNNHGYVAYLDRLFSMACFPKIVSLGIFTTAKDVSEAFAAINASRQMVTGGGDRFGKLEGRTICLCIGDGCTPRSAALACFVEGWECVSIDPEMQEKFVSGVQKSAVQGLQCFRGPMSDFMDTPSPPPLSPWDRLIVLMIHSHARLIGNATIDKIRERYGGEKLPTYLVAIPCCATFGTEKDVGKPDGVYDDDCIFSAKRTVQSWSWAA